MGSRPSSTEVSEHEMHAGPPACLVCALRGGKKSRIGSFFSILYLLSTFFFSFLFSNVDKPCVLSFFRPGPSQEGAISTYERKVKDKSKKYTILERDYGGGGAAAAAASAGGGGKKGSAKGKAKAKAIPKSKLKPKVQDFVNLIADISMMEEQMTKLGYDVSLITQRSR